MIARSRYYRSPEINGMDNDRQVEDIATASASDEFALKTCALDIDSALSWYDYEETEGLQQPLDSKRLIGPNVIAAGQERRLEDTEIRETRELMDAPWLARWLQHDPRCSPGSRPQAHSIVTHSCSCVYKHYERATFKGNGPAARLNTTAAGGKSRDS
ncbi:uncharacterized protein LAESUDRAFT_751071 [Laetiporus sulphureus 93-53]|uniref:Uncharacterized protein n=1 Tax=Laetiporus sulphureus 93-53 TaxID=1314785 RepID=A0A165DE99_9APHY|nr:uncharacterized protein LAESUDRAFT_751071 [Laetiporus sulphureus 93-53]KZT04691.1 hypothetical protein LAESUDRAFT_751071 [Laetiporus sulphureus 93-53]